MAGDTYCANCGSELPEGARFCPGCGAARGTALGPTVIEQPDEAPDPATSETVLDETGLDQTDSSAADAPSATREPDTRPSVAAPAQELDHEPRERGQPTSTPPPREDAADRTPGPAPASPQSRAPGGRRGSSPQSSAPGGPGQPPPQAGPASGSPRPGGLGDAAELARRLGAQARRPAVAVPLAGGALAALVTAAFGLVMAVAFPDADSLLGALGTDANVVTETLRHSVSFLQVPFDSLSFPDTADAGVDLHGRTAPLLLLAVPIGACALAAALLLVPRTRGKAMPARAGSCAGMVVAFATLMLIEALFSGDAKPSLPGTFFGALLWGGVGVCAGAALALRRETPSAAPDPSRPELPPLAGLIGRAAAASLRPLGVLLLITGLLGTAAWVTHSLVSYEDEENRARATVETALFAADHAVHFAELGAFVPFEPAQEDFEEAALPAPTDESDEITGDESYRIFAYRDALPAYQFVPGVILLIALPLLLALYAGFSVAGVVGTSRSPGLSAAWGAVVGPFWALAMLILDQLATKSLKIEALGRSEQISVFGSADGAGALLYFLLVGGVLGALGGLLAASTNSEAGIGGARPSG